MPSALLCWVAKQIICVGKNRKGGISAAAQAPLSLCASCQGCVRSGERALQGTQLRGFVMIVLAKMRQNSWVFSPHPFPQKTLLTNREQLVRGKHQVPPTRAQGEQEMSP